MKKRVRLYNFLIDSALFFVVVIIFSALLKDYVAEEYLKYVMIPLYYLYYFIMEWTTGQTVGKMITKSKVVNCGTDEKPKFSSILIRTLCRLIPIDFFSYLFIPMGIHDRVSKTELKQF
ncbi:RDD family protein [Formosa sp. Hel1_33_131]|uniref:RDD family protein n=1 Tax=Formosa sp. Hel1_33_131 TaxID=1336794 RepID=UPI00084E1904|nr:RDD family protein [Formosa sp. Hel1_33_131]